MLGNLPDHAAVLAVDGGASKIDVALVARDGAVIGATRFSGSAHFGLGNHSPLDTLARAIEAACRDARIESDRRPLAQTGIFCVAGADIAADDRRIARELISRGWTKEVVVRNDTFAILRTGTDRGWGVAVVCGSGLNCSGVGPDGAIVRFPSFGELSGDRGDGGGWLGRAALGAALRARDRRGSRTVLEKLVPAYFHMARATSVMEAVYLGRLDGLRLLELAPVVFGAARHGDAVSRSLIDQVADEVVANATGAIRRLHVTTREVEVVLGGGLFRSRYRPMIDRVRKGILAVAPRAELRLLKAPPVAGAALIALDRLKARKAAKARLREQLTDRRLRGGGTPPLGRQARQSA